MYILSYIHATRSIHWVCVRRTFEWKLFHYKTLTQLYQNRESKLPTPISLPFPPLDTHTHTRIILSNFTTKCHCVCVCVCACSTDRKLNEFLIRLSECVYVCMCDSLEIIRPENDLKLFLVLFVCVCVCCAINNGKPMCWAGVADKLFMRTHTHTTYSIRCFSNLMQLPQATFHPSSVVFCLSI